MTYKMSEHVNELMAAIAKAQSELSSVPKNATGHGYKYATLDDLIEMLRPVLAKHEIAVIQMPTMSDTRVQVTTLVSHSSGQWLSSVCEAPADEGRRMNAIQGVGSAISYLRRYALASIFGVPFGDDNDAQPRRQPERPRRETPTTTQPRTQATQQSNGDLATPKQIELLHVLLKKKHGDEWEDRKGDVLRKRGLNSSKQLSKDQISKWIDSLKEN